MPRRLARADLEAMVGEFDIVERYGGAAPTVDEDLHQIRRNVRLGVRVEDSGPVHGACRSLTPGRSSDISTRSKALAMPRFKLPGRSPASRGADGGRGRPGG